jgi:hypothetical protein
MKIELPKMLADTNIFTGDADGRFVLAHHLKTWKDARFVIDIGSGKTANSEEIIRMETRVTCEGSGVPVLKTPAKFLRELDGWLESAHGITSPFFKQFVLSNVMQKFEETGEETGNGRQH